MSVITCWSNCPLFELRKPFLVAGHSVSAKIQELPATAFQHSAAVGSAVLDAGNQINYMLTCQQVFVNKHNH